MKSILNSAEREKIIRRIEQLTPVSQPQWGKMNVYQMLKHCALCEEMYLGEKIYKRAFIGRLFGQMALKSALKDDKHLRKNSPTGPGFIVKEATGDVAGEKSKWISFIRQYETYPDKELTHWFFGKMSREQVGQFVYKHADHHLRQFGV